MPTPSFLRGRRAFIQASAALAGVAVIALGSCTQADRPALDSISSVVTTAVGAPTSDEARAVGFEMSQSVAAKQAPAPVPPPGSPAAQLPDPAGMIIRNGHVVVRVDSVEAAIERVRQLAASVGGSVGNVTLNTGERQLRSATLEVKVPAARFDNAMSGMSPLGTVEHSTITAEDVGEEFVDITARLANARRLEARLLDLLANRTGKLEDVLAVERELARVRLEIERHEGRIRYLSSRVATSTIVASLHEKAPLVAAPGTNVIGSAFANMWRNFVRFVAGLIEALGVLVPVAALAALGVLGWKRWAQSRGAPDAALRPGQ